MAGLSEEHVLVGPTLETHRDRLLEFIRWIESKGIRVSGTRLSEYVRVLDAVIKTPQLPCDDHEFFDRFLYTLREVHELLLIKQGLDLQEPAGCAELLRIIVGGSAFAKDDRDRRARNHQLELRIASYFIQKGHSVDLSLDTDLVATMPFGHLHVECKRIASPKQVKKRIKEAARQLRTRVGKERLSCHEYGLAVFDVTRLAYSHEGLTWGPTVYFGRQKLRDRLKELDASYDFVGPFARSKDTLFVWLQVVMPFWQMGEQEVTLFSSLYLPLAPQTGPRARAFSDLRKVLDALPNLLEPLS